MPHELAQLRRYGPIEALHIYNDSGPQFGSAKSASILFRAAGRIKPGMTSCANRAARESTSEASFRKKAANNGFFDGMAVNFAKFIGCKGR